MKKNAVLKFTIYLITLLGLLLYENSLDNKRISFKHIGRVVHRSYKELFLRMDQIGKMLIRIAITAAIALLIVFSWERSIELTGIAFSGRTFCLVGCMLIIELVLFYIVFGFSLFIFSRIELLISTTGRKKLNYRFLVSAYICCMYAFLLRYAKEEMVACGSGVMAGLLVSYLLNMTMLVHISMEPVSCCRCKYGAERRIEQKHPLKIVLSGALVLILMIILNLYLCVKMIALLFEHAYIYIGTGADVTGLDLLYYTVISFTTIGYGEIVPQRLESKIMAIVIAFTSVMCLVIFISSVLAMKGNEKG